MHFYDSLFCGSGETMISEAMILVGNSLATLIIFAGGKPYAFVEGVSTRTNELVKGYLPTSMIFPTNDIFVVRRGDDEEKTWLR